MIIKRQKHVPGNDPANPSGQGDGTAHHEEVWDQMAFDSGMAQDRRNKDRRHGYRRIEDRDLIRTAYEEAKIIHEEARAKGFSQGIQDAQAEIQKLQGQLAELMRDKEDALLGIIDEITPLAIEVAQRIIKTEVSCDDTLVARMAREAIQRVGRGAKNIMLRVHPHDVDLVRSSLKDNPIPNLQAELLVMEDLEVDQGSCIVETNGGLIDASFRTQFELLKNVFGLKDKDAEGEETQPDG
jgi:flagellar biosynthesis/type III secretory pathway protein FliH